MDDLTVTHFQLVDYKGEYTAAHPAIQAFWKAFFALDEEERKKFLQFLSGSTRLPLAGMKELKAVIQPSSPEVCGKSLPTFTNKLFFSLFLLLILASIFWIFQTFRTMSKCSDVSGFLLNILKDSLLSETYSICCTASTYFFLLPSYLVTLLFGFQILSHIFLFFSWRSSLWYFFFSLLKSKFLSSFSF